MYSLRRGLKISNVVRKEKKITTRVVNYLKSKSILVAFLLRLQTSLLECSHFPEQFGIFIVDVRQMRVPKSHFLWQIVETGKRD